ncbi:MAG TPA: type II toxin-antitoxin system RelE/ParE family toxin [Gallionella sp.]|jgi:toxin ParE1/3/4|nr:type II toxin-antitoxin system RelE/ParE family toxin [Gallionella sp.]
MKHGVLLTAGAENDLEEIFDYITEFDLPRNANHVLDQLLKVADSLASFPERGSYPKELLSLGIREYRQAHFKPYRLIYRVIEKQVFIFLIVDDRRDMQTLLARRLLSS